MTKKALDKLLATTTPRCMMLYGESEFLISHYSRLAQSRIEGIGGGISHMFFEDYNHNEAIGLLGSKSIFSEKCMLVMKLHSAPSKKQVQELFKALAMNEDGHLILEFHKSPAISNAEYAKRFKALSALFKPTKDLKDVIEVRFFNPNLAEMLDLLSHRAGELGLRFSADMLDYLLTTQNHDISIAYKELEKFIYYQHVDKNLIDALSHPLGNLDMQSLYDALFEKRGNPIAIFEKLRELGGSEADLLRELHGYFYLLFKLYAHSKGHGNMDCREILGYQPPSHVVSTWARRCIKLDTHKYLAAFDMLNEWRVAAMKGREVSMHYLLSMQRLM